jgi:hypothetical protein
VLLLEYVTSKGLTILSTRVSLQSSELNPPTHSRVVPPHFGPFTMVPVGRTLEETVHPVLKTVQELVLKYGQVVGRVQHGGGVGLHISINIRVQRLCFFLKMLRGLWVFRCKKLFLYTFFGVMEYMYEYFLEIVECKFARNGSTN